jgi:hypothetical protein
LNAAIVEPRDVFREAALGGASAIIAFHKHSATVFQDSALWFRPSIFWGDSSAKTQI